MRLLFQVLALLLIFSLVIGLLYIYDIKKEEREKKEREANEQLKYEFERDNAWENAQKQMKMRDEIKKATAEAYKPQEVQVAPNQELFNRRDPEGNHQHQGELPFKMPYFQNLGGIEKFSSQAREKNTPHFGEFAGFKRGSMSLGENRFGESNNQEVSVYSRGGRTGPSPIQPRRNLADMFGFDQSPADFTSPSTKSVNDETVEDKKPAKKSSSKGKTSTSKVKPSQSMDALSQLRSEEFASMGRK